MQYQDFAEFQAHIVGIRAPRLHNMQALRHWVTDATVLEPADVPLGPGLMAGLFFSWSGVLPQRRVCSACGESLVVVSTRRARLGEGAFPLALRGRPGCGVCGATWRAYHPLARDTFIEHMPFNHYASFLEFLRMWSMEYPQRIIAAELVGEVHRNTLGQWQTYVQELCLLDLTVGEFRGCGAVGGRAPDGTPVRVQADETLLNERKPSPLAAVARPQRRRLWLWGAVEEEDFSSFPFHILRRAEDAIDGRPRGKAELRRVLSQSIKPGTYLTTDSWRAYLYMDWAALDVQHSAVNHKHEFINEAGDHTNYIESRWGVLKRWLRKQYNGRLPDKENTYLYLFEFVWRQKLAGRDVFYGILAAMSRFYGEDLPFGDDRQAWLDAMQAAADAGVDADDVVLADV